VRRIRSKSKLPESDGNALGFVVNLGRYPKATVERIGLWNFSCLSCFSWKMHHISYSQILWITLWIACFWASKSTVFITL